MTTSAPTAFRPAPLRGLLATIRPTDTGIAVVGSLIGARVAHPALVTSSTVLLVALANGLLSAGSMAFNDWHDVAEDRINKPFRPLPAGWVSRPLVLGVALTLLLLGIAGSAAAGSASGSPARGSLC